MVTTTGNYYRLTSNGSKTNNNLKISFDILVIFKEGFDLSEDVISSLDIFIEGRLLFLGSNNPCTKKDKVKEAVIAVLNCLEYEYEEVFVKQAVTLDSLKTATFVSA